MTVEECRAAIAECERTRSKLFIETANLDARIAAEGDSPGLDERRENMNRGVAKLDAELADLASKAEAGEKARERLLTLGENPRSREEIGDGTPDRDRRATRHDADPIRSAALHAIERNADSFATKSGDVIEKLVRSSDPFAAKYIAAAGADAYHSAFGKMLADPDHGHLRFSPEEVEAVRLVSAVESERALAEGTGGAGAFAVPIALDPSIILAGAGAFSPIRQLATVTTIATSMWKGVSSVGITAAYMAEGTESTDNAPALLQPIVYMERASAFVPFSIEVSQDWPGMQDELARLLADAKSVLESEKFLSGAGHASQEPSGILTGVTSIDTAGSGAFAIADCYSIVEAVPPRFQPNCTVLGSPTIFDKAYKLVGGGSTTDPPILPTREGPFLGRAKAEWSNMAVVTTAGAKVLVAGDVRAGFRIVDRIGLSVELVAHLVGGTANYPTGQRGLFAFWRNSSTLVVPAALTQLKIKA